MAATLIPTIPASAELAEARKVWDTPAPESLITWGRIIRDTEALAAMILAAPLRTDVAGLVIVAGSWSREAGDLADATATIGSPEWEAALGAHEEVTMTEDGRSAIRNAWCQHSDAEGHDWVRYEGWTAEGRMAHGYVCAECRKLTQAG